MPFEPLETFYDEHLTLPVAPGKEYVVPSPDADTGLQVQKLTVIGQKAAQNEDLTEDDKAFLGSMPELDDEALLRRLLSDGIYDQIVADKLSWHRRQLITGAVMYWVAFGREAAEEYWNAGVSGPKPQPAQPQDHKAPAKKRSSASSTRKSSANPAKRATAARSRSGANSSTTGP